MPLLFHALVHYAILLFHNYQELNFGKSDYSDRLLVTAVCRKQLLLLEKKFGDCPQWPTMIVKISPEIPHLVESEIIYSIHLCCGDIVIGLNQSISLTYIDGEC